MSDAFDSTVKSLSSYLPPVKRSRAPSKRRIGPQKPRESLGRNLLELLLEGPKTPAELLKLAKNKRSYASRMCELRAIGFITDTVSLTAEGKKFILDLQRALKERK